jgi:hypothetical protein
VTDDDGVTDDAAVTDAPGEGQSALRVVRGEPAPEELAALTAVLTASAAGAGVPGAAGAIDAQAEIPVTGWAASTRARRQLPRVGPRAWAMSGRG